MNIYLFPIYIYISLKMLSFFVSLYKYLPYLFVWEFLKQTSRPLPFGNWVWCHIVSFITVDIFPVITFTITRITTSSKRSVLNQIMRQPNINKYRETTGRIHHIWSRPQVFFIELFLTLILGKVRLSKGYYRKLTPPPPLF